MKTVYLNGSIKQDLTAENFRKEIDFSSKEKVRMIINSPGGSVSEGIEIYNLIKSYNGDFEIIIGAMAASIASYISMAVPTENRKAFKNSSMMIHEASSGIWGRAREFKIGYERVTGVNSILAEAYSENMGKTKEEILQMMSEDFYMTGWESLLENNVISDIVDPKDIEIPDPIENEYDFFTFLFGELEKEPDANVMKEKMYLAEEETLKNIEASKRDNEKMTALLKDYKSIQSVNNKSSKTTEVNMTLQEFLKSNPDAKAEYDTALQSAEASGKEKAEGQKPEESIAQERDRFVAILAKSNTSIPEHVLTAFTKGFTVDQYSSAELDRQNAMRNGTNEEKQKFAQLNGKQTPGEQDKSTGIEAKNEEEYDEKVKATLDKIFVGGSI